MCSIHEIFNGILNITKAMQMSYDEEEKIIRINKVGYDF